MSALTILLAIKMAVTFWVVTVPAFVAPKEVLDRFSGLGDSSTTLYRLYGLAIAALVIAYGEGLRQTLEGQFPTVIVIMGIISNGGGAWILHRGGTGPLKTAAVGTFGTIAVLFVLTLMLQGWAMMKLV